MKKLNLEAGEFSEGPFLLLYLPLKKEIYVLFNSYNVPFEDETFQPTNTFPICIQICISVVTNSMFIRYVIVIRMAFCNSQRTHYPCKIEDKKDIPVRYTSILILFCRCLRCKGLWRLDRLVDNIIYVLIGVNKKHPNRKII